MTCQPRVRTVVLLGLAALLACSCGDPSPVAPSPRYRLNGTYTLTVAMSTSCPNGTGPWTYRADIEIEPDGRNYTVTLYDGKFYFASFTDTSYDRFRCQDNPDGVLFFSRGGFVNGETLFFEEMAGFWTDGTARGQFREGRIDAAFNGIGNGCRATDHSWTFVRR